MRLEVERVIPAPGGHLCGLAWDGDHLWHSDGDTEAIYQIDPADGRVVRELPCPGVRTGLAYTQGLLWQVAGRPKRIFKIDPSDGAARDEIPLGPDAESVCGLLVDAGGYWTGPEREGWITRHALDSGGLINRYGPVSSGDGLMLIADRLWYTSHRAASLCAVDLESGKAVGEFGLVGPPTDACFDGSWIWFNYFAGRELCAVRVPPV